MPDFRKQKPFAALRGKLAEFDYTYEEIAEHLHIASSTVANRMSGREDWRLSECYSILRLFQLPDSDLPILFPPS